VVALRGIAVALLLVVDFMGFAVAVVVAVAVDIVDMRLVSPNPSGADAELDKGGGEANRLCEVGGGAVTVYI